MGKNNLRLQIRLTYAGFSLSLSSLHLFSTWFLPPCPSPLLPLLSSFFLLLPSFLFPPFQFGFFPKPPPSFPSSPLFPHNCYLPRSSSCANSEIQTLLYLDPKPCFQPWVESRERDVFRSRADRWACSPAMSPVIGPLASSPLTGLMEALCRPLDKEMMELEGCLQACPCRAVRHHHSIASCCLNEF